MKKVKRWQAAVIAKAVYPMGGYLLRLKRRMVAVGFGKSDRLFDLVSRAEDALHSLWVHAHYLSSPSGTGGLSDKEEDGLPELREPGENPRATGDGPAYDLDDRRPFKPKGDNDAG